MTEFYKSIEGSYVVGIGTKGNDNVAAITETEYNQLLSVIRSAPSAPEGFVYRLRADNLEWERVAVEPEPLTDEQALTRYANSLTGASDPDLISAAETLITDRIKEEH